MTTSIVYVFMPDESVDVWCPVESEEVRHRVYWLLGTVPDGDVWQFQPGDVVRCEELVLVEGTTPVSRMVAVEKLNS
jgi:hypothetical protein